MFSQYTYKAGSTLANVLSDIIAILTGETDKNNLSSDCELTSTSIWSTVAAGWTLHDAAAGADAQCIKALCEDGVTYKYVVIDMSATNTLVTKVYESWDAVGHSGTNLCYGSESTYKSQRVGLSLLGKVFIGASSRYCVFWSWLTTSSYYGNGNNGPTGCFERTRGSPWDTTANGYPPYIWGSFTNVLETSAPRYKDLVGDVTGSYMMLSEMTEFGLIGGSTAGIPNSRTLDADLNQRHWVHEIGITYQGTLSFKVGKILDSILLTTRSYGTAEEVIIYNSNPYFVMTDAQGSRILVPRF